MILTVLTSCSLSVGVGQSMTALTLAGSIWGQQTPGRLRVEFAFLSFDEELVGKKLLEDLMDV